MNRIPTDWLVFPILILATAGAIVPQEVGVAAADPMAAVDALRAEYSEAHREFMERLRGVTDMAEREALWDARPTKAKDWTPRFWQIARASARTEAAFAALNWIRMHAASAEEHDETITLLLEHHIAHRDIGQICRRYIGAPHPSSSAAALDVPRQIIAASPHARARAEAGYCLAKVLHHRDPEKHADEVRRLLEVTVRDAEDVGGVFPFRDLSLSQVAAQELFELEHLQVGCEAPEIAAEDMQGEAFKLSDYRGKVVLLDYWGHW